MKVENNLGYDDVRQLVWRIAIPSMLAQLVSVLYNIVDRMYIGNIPEIGDIALAGVGICGPIVTMIGSFASLIGIGGSPFMSISMGEQNIKRARAILANCFLMLCICSVVLMVVLFPFREPMLLLFGASQTILPYANDYYSIYLMGTIFSLLSIGLNQFIICQGFAKIGMTSVLLGAILNIIFDPIFIFLFDMGIKGAAIATVISQMISCFFILRFLFFADIPVNITFGGYRWSIIKRVLFLGFTPFIIIAIDNVMIIVMNMVLQKYGGPQHGDTLITCATIAQSFMLVITMPLGGITGGTQTILSYNYGAKQFQRVKKAQRVIFLYCIVYTGLMFLLARIASPLFIRLFTQDEELTRQTMWAIQICTLSIIPLGIQYEIVDGFTAIGQVRWSLPLSFFRKAVYFVSLFILPMYFEAKSAFYAEPISDFIGPIVSVLVYIFMTKRIFHSQSEMD